MAILVAARTLAPGHRQNGKGLCRFDPVVRLWREMMSLKSGVEQSAVKNLI
jgi:hypothetical protein